MADAAGVLPEGFKGRTLDECYELVKAALRARLGQGLAFLPDSPETFLAGIMAEMLGELWAAAGGLWQGFDPDASQDAALDSLCALTGTERLQATASTTTLLLSGSAGTLVPAGKVVSVAGVGTRFDTTVAATLASSPAWASAHTYAVGAVVTHGGNVYVCALGGSSGVTGPSGTTSPQADGGVAWRYVGPGAAHASAPATCEALGPLPGPAYTLTSIETPVAGWQGVANPADALLGRSVEEDASLRIRRRRDLRAQGSASPDAIRGRLLDPDVIDGVTSCTVFENVTGTTNSDGVPPHSIEALVEGGEDAAIRLVLWAAKAAGIRTYGTTLGTVVDASGNTQPVAFSRPVLVQVYASATVNLTPDAPADDVEALAQLKAAVVAYGQGLQVGRNVVPSKLSGSMTALSWVDGVEGLTLGTTPSPVGTNTIPIATRQRASFDSTRLNFTLVRLAAEDL